MRVTMKKKLKALFPREFCSSYLTSSGRSWRVVVSTPWSMASTISCGLSFNVKDYFLLDVFSEMKTMLLLTRRGTKSSGTLPGSSTARYEGRTSANINFCQFSLIKHKTLKHEQQAKANENGHIRSGAILRKWVWTKIAELWQQNVDYFFQANFAL